MSNQRRAGNKGEALASIYIQNLGYTIKTINWRYRYWEVDIIAMDGDTLVFVEVKSRTTTNYGRPEFFVEQLKNKYNELETNFRSIINGAVYYGRL